MKTIKIEKSIEHYKNNKDKILEHVKEYREKNKKKISEKKKVYYQENKNKIAEKRKIKVICECVCDIRKDKIAIHRKSKKHIKLMETK